MIEPIALSQLMQPNPDPDLSKNFQHPHGFKTIEKYWGATTSFEKEFWIFESSETPGSIEKGCIGANISEVDHHLGYVGFFEASSYSCAQKLVRKAIDWLQQRGIKKIYAPVNWNTWFDYRYTIDKGEFEETFSFEPKNPDSYPKWFQNLGFELAHTYHSQASSEIFGLIQSCEKDFRASSEKGYKYQAGFPDLRTLHTLSMKSFEKSFLFEAVPFETFATFYKTTPPTQFVLTYVSNPKGEIVGFFYGFMEKGFFVLKTIAVLPEFRGLGLSNAMMFQACKQAQDWGAQRTLAAMIKDGGQSESYTKKDPAQWRHQYGLFSKEINP